MSGSREDSPDWLRSFQAPGKITLSSGSESPLDNSPLSDDDDSMNLSKLFRKDKSSQSEAKSSQDGQSEVNSPVKTSKVERTPTKKRKKENQSEKEGKSTDKVFTKRRALEKPSTVKETSHSVWTLSSDSEPSHDSGSEKVEKVLEEELLMHDVKPKKEEIDVASMQKSPKKKLKEEDQKKKKKLESQLKEEKEDGDVLEEIVPEKQSGPNMSSSRLPLVLPEKVQRTKALVECDGDNVDLSGDVGSVGRIVVSDGPSGNHEMLFDLKGTIYKTTILPSRTFCVVSFGQSEAKVEAIMNDFIQLKPQSNVYEAETMVEGTLDGFTFDSDEEAENLPRPAAQGDQEEDVDNQTNGNAKTKSKKASAMEQKKGKKGGTIPKKVKKKTQVQKNNQKKKPQVQKKSKSKK